MTVRKDWRPEGGFDMAGPPGGDSQRRPNAGNDVLQACAAKMSFS